MEETTKTAPEAAKPAFWAVLPAAVRYDEELPPNAKLLYAEISSLTDRRGHCYASNEYFMRVFSLSERTVQNLLNALKRGGYIRITNGSGGSGRRKIYAGLNPLMDNPAENCGVTPQKIAPNPAKNCTQTNLSTKKKTNPPKAPQGAGTDIWDKPAWDRFWAIYPRKVDKTKAIRAWNKLKADRKLMQIMSAALKAQSASEEWRRDNGRAVPYPSTWLNNRRWEDEPTAFSPAAAAAPSEEAEVWL